MRTRSLFTLLPLVASLHAYSQSTSHTPDAGSLRQQIEQQRELPLPQAAPEPRVSPPPAAQPHQGVSIAVKSFRIAGNTLLSSDALLASLTEFVGHELDYAGLQRASDAVSGAYRQAGWLARVYLPKQDVSAGVITLQVVESRFAGLRFEGQPSQRVMPEETAAYFKAQQLSGEFLNTQALDRALLLADDLPGVSVAGTLEPGAQDGYTALVLQTTDEPFIYGDIGLDNTGSRSTGSDRLSANLNFNSPGLRGELLSLSALHTQGSDYGRIALTVPDHHNGLRLGVSLSSMTYKVIDGPSYNSATPIRGNSGSLGIDWSYPLVRQRMGNLYFSGGLENKTFFTQDTQVRSDYASDSLRLGLSGNQFDSFMGGGANSATVQLLWGKLTDIQAHNLIDTIDRSYHKLSYSFTRQQTLTSRQSLLLSLQGQHADQSLDSSEKFYIGGAQSVRAYPASELSGDSGHVASAEWRVQLHQALVFSAFVDMGRVITLPATSSDTRTHRALFGHGLSLSWQGPKGLSTKVTWARRHGSNPQPTSTGTDGDGTLKENRFWLTASLPFSF